MARILPPAQWLRHSVALVAALGLCGASPQDEGNRRVTPQPRSPMSPSSGMGSGRVAPSEGPRHTPAPRSADGSFGRPGPRHREVEDRRPTEMPQSPRLAFYTGTQVVIPPSTPRCRVVPTPDYWRHRDLMAEIQWLSRRGFIPVTALADGTDALSDFVENPAGWRAYGIAVPPGGTVQFEVEHEKLAWFRLMLVDKWGQPGPGMLRAAIAHRPVVVGYTNPGPKATSVYVIVDDPAWWSDAANPYTLRVRRDWDTAKVDLSAVKLVTGLWGATPSVSAQFRGRSFTGPAVYPH